MLNKDIIEIFKKKLNGYSSFSNFKEKNQDYSSLNLFFGTSQKINFDIVNFVSENLNRTYYKINSIEEAKDIWIKVLDDLPAEEMGNVFETYIGNFNINIEKQLFFSIYVLNL